MKFNFYGFEVYSEDFDEIGWLNAYNELVLCYINQINWANE